MLTAIFENLPWIILALVLLGIAGLGAVVAHETQEVRRDLRVGLGPSRFWEALGWVCGHVAMLALSLFCGGVAAGEWIASKLGWRK